MDAKEIELRGKAITKAYSANEPPGTILNLLNELKGGVQVTEELLRSTKIGLIVNRVKQHKDPAVARLAGELISKWRTDVRKSGPNSPTALKGGGASKVAPSPTAANGSETPTEAKAKHTVAPENRSAKADKVNTNLTGSAIRDNCLRLMYDGLALMSEERKWLPFVCSLPWPMSMGLLLIFCRRSTDDLRNSSRRRARNRASRRSRSILGLSA